MKENWKTVLKGCRGIRESLTNTHVHGTMNILNKGVQNMQMSLSKFRAEMFRLLPTLKNNEELILTFEGQAAYVLRKANVNRKSTFMEALNQCPKLYVGDEDIIAFKNEGRK